MSKSDGQAPRQVDWQNLLAALGGFCIGLVLMYSIKALDLDGDDDEEDLKDIENQPQLSVDPNIPNLSEPLLDGACTPSEPGTPMSQREVGDFLMGPGNDAESQTLLASCGRIAQDTQALGQFVQADNFDRDLLDEKVHSASYHVDAARRACRGADNSFDQRGASRVRAQVAELTARVTQLRELSAKKSSASALDTQLRHVRRSVKQIHLHAHKAKFRRWAPRSDDAMSIISQRSARFLGDEVKANNDDENEKVTEPSGGVPWALVLAVVVDSVVDGMLIGLASAVTLSSGWLMSLATAIEMGFLGYSFSCTLVAEVRHCLATALAAIPPIAMTVSSVIAAQSSSTLQGTPAFSGLVAFALVALLFLVVQELLLEAQEKDGGELWHASIWLYIGLLLSVGVDVVIG